jgi:ribosome-binding factor A
MSMPERGVPRRARVERDLQQELALALRQLGDPRLRTASVTRVHLTEDLAFARVYIRSGPEVQSDEKSLMKAVKAVSGRLRGHVGRTMQLRKAPELRFIYDAGFEAQERVDALLEEIRVERESQRGADAADDADDDVGD